jgi:hypothetical protein
MYLANYDIKNSASQTPHIKKHYSILSFILKLLKYFISKEPTVASVQTPDKLLAQVQGRRSLSENLGDTPNTARSEAGATRESWHSAPYICHVTVLCLSEKRRSFFGLLAV